MDRPLIEVTKVFTFDSAHNLEQYHGKCESLHGHTYKLEITVKGPVDDEGMVIDFLELKNIVDKKIINKVDHQYLNKVFPFNTTCENIITWIWETLEKEFKDRSCWLERVKLWETPTNYAVLSKSDKNE
ncbi:MAG: 6-pyruvoyltetrahydropterin/6-carboxytetrahydropterin synthase [Thermosediminibacterales bacterium]|nr:6-pyruvoyltetrahydropterin/6-carboxytetrahydropterin synthase [Thermosediminibacterales bacterium]